MASPIRRRLAPTAEFRCVESFATNLVPSDTNDTSDIFLHDRMTSTTVRLSVSTGGTRRPDIRTTPR